MSHDSGRVNTLALTRSHLPTQVTKRLQDHNITNIERFLDLADFDFDALCAFLAISEMELRQLVKMVKRDFPEIAARVPELHSHLDDGWTAPPSGVIPENWPTKR